MRCLGCPKHTCWILWVPVHGPSRTLLGVRCFLNFIGMSLSWLVFMGCPSQILSSLACPYDMSAPLSKWDACCISEFGYANHIMGSSGSFCSPHFLGECRARRHCPHLDLLLRTSLPVGNFVCHLSLLVAKVVSARELLSCFVSFVCRRLLMIACWLSKHTVAFLRMYSINIWFPRFLCFLKSLRLESV